MSHTNYYQIENRRSKRPYSEYEFGPGNYECFASMPPDVQLEGPQRAEAERRKSVQQVLSAEALQAAMTGLGAHSAAVIQAALA